MRKFLLLILVSEIVFLTGCVTPRPNNVENICSIFRQYPDWYWATQRVARKWHVPVNVQMAVIHQESHFNATAKPPRTKLLWIIPWKRPTSAYGYSQAINGTWRRYKTATGNAAASRYNFADAVDFIGWYATKAYWRAGVDRTNAFQVYLAFHEGIGGYQAHSYHRNPGIMFIARKVANLSYRYRMQLASCEASLKRKPWWHLWQ